GRERLEAAMGDRSAAAGLALALGLLGCGKSPKGPPSIAPTATASAPSAAVDAGASGEARPRDWTVLIYMAADNDDLPLYAYRNIEEIESAALSASMDVVVQLDLKTPPGIRRLHMIRAPADGKPLPKITERTPGDIRSPVVALQEDESIPPA